MDMTLSSPNARRMPARDRHNEPFGHACLGISTAMYLAVWLAATEVLQLGPLFRVVLGV